MPKKARVLILGQTFNNIGGSGITLSRLFSKFESSELAVISDDAYVSDLKTTAKVFQLGENETGKIFPFNIFYSPIASGKIDPHSRPLPLSGNRRFFHQIIRLIYHRLINVLGLNFIERRCQISPELDRWINDYRPDVLYTQLSTLGLIRMAQKIKSKYQLPLVIHIMDDWPTTINKPNLLYFYWRYKIGHEIKKIFNQASLLLGISDAMCDVYQERYHRPCTAFHNPIKLTEWLPYQKKTWLIPADRPTNIIYFGVIHNLVNEAALIKFAEAIERINRRGFKVKFDIYTFQHQGSAANKLNRFNGVRVHRNVSPRLIPKTVSKYDICLIPFNSNRYTNKFAKLSMPTKASECMISGVPIFVFTDPSAALFGYAQKERWGFAVATKRAELEESIIQLIQDEGMRKRLAKRAMSIAESKFQIDSVAGNFKELLDNCATE